MLDPKPFYEVTKIPGQQIHDHILHWTKTQRSMQLLLTHALVSIWLKLAKRVHFCDEFFIGGVNIKNSNLDALFCQI